MECVSIRLDVVLVMICQHYWAGCLICCEAVRAAGQTSAVRVGPGCGPGYVKICGAGRAGPIDIVAGRVRAQLFQPAQFLSKFAYCLCLLVVGLPDSSLCV